MNGFRRRYLCRHCLCSGQSTYLLVVSCHRSIPSTLVQWRRTSSRNRRSRCAIASTEVLPKICRPLTRSSARSGRENACCHMRSVREIHRIWWHLLRPSSLSPSRRWWHARSPFSDRTHLRTFLTHLLSPSLLLSKWMAILLANLFSVFASSSPLYPINHQLIIADLYFLCWFFLADSWRCNRHFPCVCPKLFYIFFFIIIFFSSSFIGGRDLPVVARTGLSLVVWCVECGLIVDGLKATEI